LETTSPSLISRLRDPADHQAWRDFENRYRELLVRFCQRRGLQRADAEDVVQSVFASLARSLPGFLYDPSRGRFRDYLFRCARNGLSAWAQRPGAGDAPLDTGLAAALAAEPERSDPAELAQWEQEWVAHHYRQALETVRRTFEPRSVEVFDRCVAGARTQDLAAEFGMTEPAIRKVRQRVRERMESLIALQVRQEDEL
jgi:RNA polymerase sigma-70 factor (ECF subfamily)